jgi:hypothetical protein
MVSDGPFFEIGPDLRKSKLAIKSSHLELPKNVVLSKEEMLEVIVLVKKIYLEGLFHKRPLLSIALLLTFQAIEHKIRKGTIFRSRPNQMTLEKHVISTYAWTSSYKSSPNMQSVALALKIEEGELRLIVTINSSE